MLKEYTAVISREAKKYISILEKDFDILTVSPDHNLQKPVQCHADMIISLVGNYAVLPETYAAENIGFVTHLSEKCGLEVITTAAVREADYPFDISLNVLLCNSYAFSFKKYTSRCVTDILNKLGYTHVNVRQGYAACSSLAGDRFIITADPSVEKAARSTGIDVLRITEGGIRLDGYSSGFIGGASGVCGNKIYFLGNIMLHPDSKNIVKITEKYGYDIVNLSDEPLSDFGGIKFIKNVICGP